jgi:hypothetical protein
MFLMRRSLLLHVCVVLYLSCVMLVSLLFHVCVVLYLSCIMLVSLLFHVCVVLCFFNEKMMRFALY